MEMQPLPPAPSPKRRGGEGTKQPLPPTPSPKRRGGAKPKPSAVDPSLHSSSPSPLRGGGRGEGLNPPPLRNIVVGQRVAVEKVIRAKQFRRRLTPAERRLWECLRRNQLKGLHFRRQQVIEGFIADFYCHSAGMVVEVDGAIHDLQAVADAERDLVFAGLGLQVLRFTNEDVLLKTESVLGRIAQACGGGETPSPRPPPRNGEGEQEFPGPRV